MKISILFMIFSAIVLSASSNSSVTGIINETNKLALPYANVILINTSDSSVVKATLTDESGKYKFEDIPDGNYRILIAQLGFEKHYSDSFHLSQNSPAKNFDTIILNSALVNLKEANVTALRPLIERRVDRTIVNVENSIVNAGSTALEILQRSPGVTVDNEGNIILSGKQGVLVMMDGKPTYLSRRDLFELLKNMNSDQLSMIEIITNPSAKYDAAGTSGIINIKLRKKQNTGFNGRVQVSYGQGVYPDFGSGFSLNYGNERINLFSGYDYMNGYYYEETNMTRKFTGVNGSSAFIQHSYDKGHFINNTFRGGADIFFSKKHTLGMILKGNRYTNDDNTASITDIYSGAIPDSGYITHNTSDSKWSNYSVNLNYRYRIDTLGQEFSADADYARFDNHNNFIFKTDHYFTGNDYTYTDLATNDQPATIDIKSFKVDYILPFKKNIKFEAGGKTSFVVTDNDVKYFNYSNGIAVYDLGKSNHFKYKENINAGYVNWSGEFGKVGLQTGLRFEQTISEGVQLADNSSFDRNYAQIFPSMFLSYKFTDKHQAGASYSRRIHRPDYQQMNPFRYFLDPYNYMQGNPLLEPQLTNNFELSYTFMQMYTLTFNYSHTKDAMTQITKQVDSTHTTFVTTENLDSYNNYGMNISVPVKITEWLHSSCNFNLFHNKYKGYSTAGFVEKYLTSHTFNSTNSIKLPKGFSVEVNFWYNSKMVWGTWLVDPNFNLSAGISKMFMNERFQLRINLNDIFHTEVTDSKIQYQNIDATFRRVYDSQFVRFHVAYKFGKQMQRSRMRASGAQEEQNRVRQGR